MSFSAVMQNLAIGIAGGIFSSIIVSVVFYLLNEYQNELNMAKDMMYPLYGLVALILTESKKISKELKREEVAKEYFFDASDNFEKFEPWKFKYELKDIMCDAYEILIDGKYLLCEWDDEIMHEVSKKIQHDLHGLEQCERNFAKGFLKRVFKNKIIITAEIVFAGLVMIA